MGRAELEQQYAELRAQAVGPNMHSEDIGRRMAAIVGQIAALPPEEPVEAPTTPTRSRAAQLVEAEALLAKLGGPERNPHLSAAIEAERQAGNETNDFVPADAGELELSDHPSAIAARAWLSEQAERESAA